MDHYHYYIHQTSFRGQNKGNDCYLYQIKHYVERERRVKSILIQVKKERFVVNYFLPEVSLLLNFLFPRNHIWECMPENYQKILELDRRLKLMIKEVESEKN